MYPTLAMVLRLVFLGKLAGGRIRRMDFCSIPGRLTWFLWRIGLVGLANRRMLRRLRRAGSPARSEGSEARHPGLTSVTIAAVHKT